MLQACPGDWTSTVPPNLQGLESFKKEKIAGLPAADTKILSSTL